MLGALTGLSVAGWEAVEVRLAPDRHDAAAIVNNVAISQADYRHALQLLSGARRTELAEEDRRLVLDRLIEEELLFQRAGEIGLPRTHGNLRTSIVQTMISFILDDGSSFDPPSDDLLKRFYDQNTAWFMPKERIRLAQIYLRPGEEVRAQKIAELLRRGASFEALAQRGDEIIAGIPDMLLPPEKLFEYLGADLTRRARAMQPGDIAGPIKTESGLHFLFLRERQKPVPPRFEDIRPQILRYYARRQEEQKLKNYLARLRDEADIEFFQ